MLPPAVRWHMKRLSYDEFRERSIEIAKAMQIFIPHITNNINQAFSIYQQLLATEGAGHVTALITRDELPAQAIYCPECGAQMRLMLGPVDINGYRWPTAWACSDCLATYYSNKTETDWLEYLKIIE